MVGAVSGAVSVGIGQVAKNMVEVGKSSFLFQAGAHGGFGGIMSVIDGGNFGSGFASGAVSSIISSGVELFADIQNMFTFIGDKGISDNAIKAIQIAAGGLSGGISSSIAGGNFWSGARQGVITSGLNHAVNHIKESWKYLTKRRLARYARSQGIMGEGINFERQLGSAFENAYHKDASLHASGYSSEGGLFSTSSRSSRARPDGVSLARTFITKFPDFWNSYFADAPTGHFHEVKASDGTLYNSTNKGQLRGHIFALRENLNSLPGGKNYKGILTFATTALTNVSKSLYKTAYKQGITVRHIRAQYQINNGIMRIRFYNSSNGVPIGF